MPNVAASVRAQKEKNPELFCADRKCLWRIVKRDGTLSPCQNHKAPEPVASSDGPLTLNGYGQ
jgi:hypothetical protein